MTENRYVGIGNFVDLRRDVLETSKEVILNLQVAEELRELRISKLASVREFEHELKDVRSTIRKLRKFFPKSHLSNAKPSDVKVKVSKVENKEVLSQFEHDLESLEKELASLSK